MKKAANIIRSSENIRFTLDSDVMKERTDWKPYYLYRSSLKQAIVSNLAHVLYFTTSESLLGGDWSAAGHISHGVTQRKKKYIDIGCMRFVGENRTRLIRWAMSAL